MEELGESPWGQKPSSSPQAQRVLRVAEDGLHARWLASQQEILGKQRQAAAPLPKQPAAFSSPPNRVMKRGLPSAAAEGSPWGSAQLAQCYREPGSAKAGKLTSPGSQPRSCRRES